MAKSSVLDEAIAAVAPTKKGNRVDRCLSGLRGSAFNEFDRLLDILADDERFGNKQVAGIIRHLCDEFKVEHEGVNRDNVAQWRANQAGL